ncbi:hypothetical protein BDV06DRAFT_8465 [Aspergillus oleicola]
MLRDKELAVKKSERRFENVRLNDLRTHPDVPSSVSHMIHDRCWTLLTRVIDLDTMARNLDTLFSQRFTHPVVGSPGIWSMREPCTTTKLPGYEKATKAIKCCLWKALPRLSRNVHGHGRATRHNSR